MDNNRAFYEDAEHCHYSGLPSMEFYQLKNATAELSAADMDRIIEMAWEDRTPFDAIEVQFGYTEVQVIELMCRELKASSFKRWRSRVSGRSTKHAALRGGNVTRFKCTLQKSISFNKISKR